MRSYPGGFITATAPTVTSTSAKGIWTVEEALQYIKAGNWPLPPPPGDTYFNYTTLLLPGDGTNGAQNNTFLDSSTNAFSITRNGSTTQGTFTPFTAPNGYWGNYFDGTGDSLTSSGGGVSGTGAFTVEFWMYPSKTGAQQLIYGDNTSGSLYIYFFSDDLFYVSNFNVTNQFSSISISQNTWNHVVVVRDSSGNYSVFLNGTRVATLTGNTTNYSAMSTVRIGGQASANYFGGYLSNLRVSTNAALYDPTASTITVPTTPLTAITNTSLLTCQSNRFIDNSTNNFAITRNGDVSVQAFSPFAPTAAYSAATNGGSGYFDGTGDSLLQNTASNWTFISSGASDWTIEFDVYYSSTSLLSILDNSNATSSSYGFTVAINNDTAGKVDLQIRRGVTGSNAIFRSNAALKTNQWNHVAITFTSSTKTATFYINGVQEGSTAQSGFSYTSTTPSYGLYVGTFAATSGYDFSGYLANLRISDTLRTGLTTVPTAPYTSDGNTKLLLNFTNAGIIDATAKNDLETVGNAQISNGAAKFGSTSMYFDGTGDYLKVNGNSAPSQRIGFGTGDFTIEAWVYCTSASAENNGIYDARYSASATGPLLYYIPGSGMYMFYNGDNRIGGATITINTWNHVALVRYSGSTRLYINGTQSGSTYTDTNNYTSGVNSNVIGAIYDGTGSWNGYLQDVRITKGIARYTQNFTPPTAAFQLL